MGNTTATKLEAMGCRVKVGHPKPSWRSAHPPTTLNVLSDKRGEYFEILLNKEDELRVVDVDKKDRHALLMISTPQYNVHGHNIGSDNKRFLCGHDERHWFVAGISIPVSKVAAAKDSLKPTEVREAERRAGVRNHKRHRRHNPGSIRQGEWFFVPAPDVIIDPKLILRNEPLRRGPSKPHNMEFAYRSGGESVMVCSRYPNGLTVKQHKALLRDTPDASTFVWTPMSRNASVYCKGRITHADHATVTLKGWHRVFMNSEAASRNVAFLD